MSLPALRGLGCSSAFDGAQRARIGFNRLPQLIRPRFTSPALAAFSAAEVHDKAGVMGKQSLEEILAAIRTIVPPMAPTKHKGQAGKIAVVGGCREYTGAPYFAAISALKMGADLSHVFCTNGAASVIKSYSPELIVHPILFESYEGGDKDTSIKEVEKWLPRFDCLVIGPGLGRDPALLDCVSDIIRRARSKNIPLVLDGDGLFLVTNDPDLVIGYPLAVLTPNVNEHKRLAEKMKGPDHEVKPDEVPQELMSLAERMGGVTIMQKGSTDFISDGNTVLASDFFGAPRRCGGQGDVLSGSTAVFTSWARQALSNPEGSSKQAVERLSTNPAMLGALAGSVLVRKSAQAAFARHRRSTVTSNLIECLGESMYELCPL